MRVGDQGFAQQADGVVDLAANECGIAGSQAGFAGKALVACQGGCALKSGQGVVDVWRRRALGSFGPLVWRRRLCRGRRCGFFGRRHGPQRQGLADVVFDDGTLVVGDGDGASEPFQGHVDVAMVQCPLPGGEVWFGTREYRGCVADGHGRRRCIASGGAGDHQGQQEDAHWYPVTVARSGTRSQSIIMNNPTANSGHDASA